MTRSLVIQDVEKHLSDTPQDARAIWTKIDRWSLVTIRDALHALVDVGKAVKQPEPYRNSQIRFVYRRASPRCFT